MTGPLSEESPLIRLWNEVDNALYGLIFHYFGDAKTSLAMARAIMDIELQEWADEEGRCVRAWLESAYPPYDKIGEERAHHMGFALGMCQAIIRRRALKALGVIPADRADPNLKWPSDLR